MYQNIIPYTLRNWVALCWAIGDRNGFLKSWNDGFLTWLEVKLPAGHYAFGFDLEFDTLYVEEM